VVIRTPDTDPASLQVSDIRGFFGQDYRDPQVVDGHRERVPGGVRDLPRVGLGVVAGQRAAWIDPLAR